MPLAPWNNPIVISAFRLLARRTRLLGRTTMYLLFLTGIGAVLEQTDLRFADSFVLTYFVCLIAVQWFISSLWASSASMNAMKKEVTDGTFDIQRIATLSPLDILLGKLLGEPAGAYFGIIASFPLALLCALAGAVPLIVLVLAYCTLITSTLLTGTGGLRSQMALADVVPGRKAAGCMTAVIWIAGSQMLTISSMKPTAILSVPYLAGLLGLVTPLPLLAVLANDTPFAGILWFGVPIPYVVLTPAAQLVLTVWYFRGMERQLIHPLVPPAGKLLSYLMLLAFDLLVAGVLFEQAHWTLELPARGAAFCLMHLLAGLYLMAEATPHAATLQSWAWRFRASSGLRDAWLGDRTENGLLLVTFAGIGPLGLALLVVLPAAMVGGTDILSAALPELAGAAATSTLLLLAIGTLYQRSIFRHGAEGGVLAAFFVILAMIVPLGFGLWYHNDFLSGMSPLFHFFGWVTDDPVSAVYLWPMLLAYGWLLVAARMRFRREMRALERKIDATLKQMHAAASPAS